jgi:hypothetical protein
MSHQVLKAFDLSKGALLLERKRGGAPNKPVLPGAGLHSSVIQIGLGGVVWSSR